MEYLGSPSECRQRLAGHPCRQCLILSSLTSPGCSPISQAGAQSSERSSNGSRPHKQKEHRRAEGQARPGLRLQTLPVHQNALLRSVPPHRCRSWLGLVCLAIPPRESGRGLTQGCRLTTLRTCVILERHQCAHPACWTHPLSREGLAHCSTVARVFPKKGLLDRPPPFPSQISRPEITRVC